MATIDYKQKIKDYMNSSEVDTLYKSMLNNLFPELKESENERIRKALLKFHKSTIDIDGIKGEQIIAWLEKQGEQKPAWSEEDKGNLLDVKCIIDEIWNNQYVRETIDHSCEELESLWHWLDNIWQRVEFPQPTWKPSDEQMDALRYVTNFDYGGHKATLVSFYEQLKKLREK